MLITIRVIMAQWYEEGSCEVSVGNSVSRSSFISRMPTRVF